MKKYKIFAVIILFIITIRMTDGYHLKNYTQANGYISVSSEITMEVNTNRVLNSQNAEIKRPMASTTKVLTAITVIENNADLSKTVEIKKSYTGIEGSSIYLQEGEKLTLKELLYGLMLRSGNDCAVALACETSGSIEKFAELMNSTAKKAGAENSNFVNPHGLHNDNHYTTAYDLARISCYAMKNPIFKEIVGTKSIKISALEGCRLLINKNKMLNEYEGATGIKTGFTKKAGRCLVSSAYRNGMEVVCVVLGCQPMFEESKQLLNNAFNNYSYCEIFNAENFNEKIKVAGTDAYCTLKTDSSFFYPLKKDEQSNIKVNIICPEQIVPPFDENDIVGKVEIYYENQLLFSENIYTIIGIKHKDYDYILKDIIAFWRII